MSSVEQKTELLIEDYLDGRLDGVERERFEARIAEDEKLREKVETATQSVEILRRALSSMEPSSDFEEKVSSQIIQITQSNQMLPAFARKKSHGALTATDPDAGLLDDPDSNREKRRLMVIAAVAAVLFGSAVAVIGALLLFNN